MAETTIRRNGQLSSCEPCRKAKVRCDHGRPQCGRCIRRRMAPSQCYYHPAPMSASRKAPSEVSSAYESALTPTSSHSASMATPFSMTTATSPPSENLDRVTGLIGMHGTLGLFANADDLHGSRAYAAITRTGVATPSHPVPIPPAMVDEGAAMLGMLLEWLSGNEDVMSHYLVDYGDYIVGGPLVRAINPVVSRVLHVLRADRSQDKLYQMSTRIFEVSSQPFKFPPTADARALEEAVCPGVPRWESIGLFASSMALFLASDHHMDSSADGYHHQKAVRSSKARKCFDVAIQCEAFTHTQGQVNDLTLWLMTTATMSSTWSFGDDSYCTWRSMSILASMIIALDLHRSTQDSSDLPHYVLQLRKRAISLAHEIDKGMATFVGRPPFMNRLYCSMNPPLDLPDSVVMGTLEEFEAAKANLDPNGWNTDGKLYPSVRGRVMALINPYREEALELAMGNSTADPEYRANQILTRLAATWQSIPAHLRHDTAQHEGLSETHTSILSFLRLEYLYTYFLVYKRIVSYNERYRHELIQVSHEIVSLVLSMLKRRTSLVFHRNDSEWATALFALPCAGVLLLELFRQVRQPQSQVVLNRSTIIKDISALIVCCDWLTETGQGNYQTVRQAQSIFSRGLDQVLDHPKLFDDNASPSGRGMESSTAATNDNPAELTDVDFAKLLPQDLEWSTWLESFGLETDPWFDLGHQPAGDFPMVEG